MKDPGQEAIAYCAAKYSQMVDDVDYYEQQRKQYIAWAAQDCTEAVDQTDENIVARSLASIGNRARWLSRDGDTDDKLAYIDEVLKVMDALIHNYAQVAASIDLDHRLDNADSNKRAWRRDPL